MILNLILRDEAQYDAWINRGVLYLKNSEFENIVQPPDIFLLARVAAAVELAGCALPRLRSVQMLFLRV